jgi:vacuolar-type H+-ATPase subunit H
LKANSRTQKQRIEEARQEASRRIAEAKEHARNGHPRD